jgi:DNA (cytosine-5)-methyltransferase 1
MVKYTVISLFAGGGGSSLGYKMAGFKELLAIELDKNAVETLQANFSFDIWRTDITQLKDGEILNRCNIKKGELDILDGSPPCQGFSTVGKRDLKDLRNELYKTYINIVNDLQPKVFVMENVTGMAKGKMKGKFNEILKDLKSLNYNVKCKQMNAKYYNVAQSRERLIFIGIRKDLGIEPSFPLCNNKIISVKDAIKGVKNTEIIKPKGDIDKNYYNIVIGKDLATYYESIGMKRKSYSCKKVNPNKPLNTLTKLFVAGMSGLLHWEDKRFMSIEEMKRCCSFPDDYILTGDFKAKWALLGNSVMPNMMKAIGENIKTQILNPYYNGLK